MLVVDRINVGFDLLEGLASGDPQLASLAGQGKRLLGVVRVFLGIDLFDDRCTGLGKEPLRFGTAGSAVAVVVPVDPCGH